MDIKIKKVNVVSLAKILGVIYGAFGFLVGLFVSILNLFGVEGSGDAGQLQSVGFLGIIIFPLIYAIIGALSGLVTAFIFNFATKWVGPLELDGE